MCRALTRCDCSAAAVWWRNAVLDLGNRDQVGSVLHTKHNDFGDASRTMQVPAHAVLPTCCPPQTGRTPEDRGSSMYSARHRIVTIQQRAVAAVCGAG